MYEGTQEVSLTREFRPKKVSDYIGNDTMVNSFYTSVRKKKLPQVVMIEGVTGCGKTTFARLMTKEYLCEQPTENGACGVCETCIDIDQYIETGVAPQGVYEIDSSVDDNKRAIDSLLENALIPDFTKYKVYIVDEFHAVQPSAQTRFLKLIEEPPAHLVFIFCTTDIEKILPTVRNRCTETYRVAKPDLNTLVKRLKEICDIKDIPCEKDGLIMIAKKSNQIIRSALNFLEKVIKEKGLVSAETVSECLEIVDTKDFMKVMRYIRGKKIQPYISWVSEIGDHTLYLNSLLDYCKTGLYVTNNAGNMDAYTKEEIKEFSIVFKDVTLDEFFRLFSTLIDVKEKAVSDEIKLLMFGLKLMGIGNDLTEVKVVKDNADVLNEQYIANKNYMDRHKKKTVGVDELVREADLEDVIRIFGSTPVDMGIKNKTKS